MACGLAKNVDDDGSWTSADAKTKSDLVEKVGVVHHELAWVDAMDRRDHEETAVKFSGHASAEGRDDDGAAAVVAAAAEEEEGDGNTSAAARVGDTAVVVPVDEAQIAVGNAAAAVDEGAGAGDYVVLVDGLAADVAAEAVDGHGSPADSTRDDVVPNVGQTDLAKSYCSCCCWCCYCCFHRRC